MRITGDKAESRKRSRWGCIITGLLKTNAYEKCRIMLICKHLDGSQCNCVNLMHNHAVETINLNNLHLCLS